MTSFALCAVVSFAVAMAIGPGCLKWLKKLKFGSTENALGPQSHQTKSGTPVMGGVIFFVPIALIALGLLVFYREATLAMALLTTVCFAAIGFADDYIKLSKKRSEGLTPRQKMIPMLGLSLALSVWAYLTPGIGSGLIVPFSGAVWDIGIFYIPVMTFVLVATVNSANLLDGVDGLLSSCAGVDFLALGAVCLSLAAGAAQGESMAHLGLFCGACFGGVLGFLRFNTHPARVFMGDGGSFTLGGAVVAVAMITRTSLFLPFIALAMFVSSLSDIIQVGYFKYTKKKTGTGRRVFRMAPLHHHFELGGMDETRIVWMYTAVTVLMCLLTLGSLIG